MKKQIVTLIALLFFFFDVSAQEFPKGIKYQAVARDLSGNILAEKSISLKITLFSPSEKQENGRTPSYVELHQTQTNKFGLFSLTIGEGKVELGKFKKIPWSNQEIWLAVDIDPNGGNNFLTISESKLLAVPYAIHAQSASQLVDGNSEIMRGLDETTVWEIDGTTLKPSQSGYIGTLGFRDFIIITNGIPRVTVGVDGNVQVENNLDVDGQVTIAELDVEGSVNLNTADGKTTIQGETTINGKTTINAPTTINAKSTFNEDVLVEADVNVIGKSIFDGTVDIYEDQHSITSVILNEKTGTTTIFGATTVHNTLDIDKSVHLNRTEGTTTIDGITTITNPTNSTEISNGALNVDGGVGIEKDVNIGGKTNMEGTLEVRTDGNAGALGGHVAEFENKSDGNGITIKVGSTQPKNNNNFITFKNGSGTVVGRIEGESTASDLANNPKYQQQLDFYDGDIVMAGRDIEAAENDLQIEEISEAITIAELVIAGVDGVISLADLGMAIAEAFASTTSSTFCAGVGGCVTSPIPSFITSSAANVIVATANTVSSAANFATTTANTVLAAEGVDLAQASLGLAQLNKENIIGDRADFVDVHQMHTGVTYASGAGDYAEYLPKLNLQESFKAGEVIGLKNGKVSRNTLGADRIMVVSFKPAVLGALPEEGNEDDFVKVAFLGQILTKTMGKVSKGDYILPSGFHNGVAMAKNPSEMLLSDYKKILGVAWTKAENNGINYINVAVGLNTNDMSGVIQHQQKELELLNGQMEILADLVPGFREAVNMDSPDHTPKTTTSVNTVTYQKDQDHDDHNHEYRNQHNTEMVVPPAESIVYYEFTSEDCKNGIELARKIMSNRGIDLSEHPFWVRLDTDPDYEEEVIRIVKKELKEAIHYHVEIDGK